MLEECPEEYIYRSKDGCVEECRKPVEQSVGGCAVSTDFVGRISVEIDGMFCETERDFEVNMCSGECTVSDFRQKASSRIAPNFFTKNDNKQYKTPDEVWIIL